MSNFRKRNIQKPLPGTKTSAQTGQVITSSGNPSLDLILGGGLPIGSICLIEEDKYVTHSKVLAKYFLAEGVLWQQSIFLGSLDDNPSELMRKLPRPLDDNEIEKENAEADEAGEGMPKNGLRIAWRYGDMPLVNSEQTTAKIGHHFNLMEHMEPHYLNYSETVTWCARKPRAISEDQQDDMDLVTHKPETANSSTISADSEGNAEMQTDMENVGNSGEGNNITLSGNVEMDVPKSDETTTSEESTTTTGDAVNAEKPKIFYNHKFEQLWTEVHGLLRERKFNETALLHKSLCRVCITSLGSPLWYDEEFAHDILKFLTILRATVRSQTSVCFITMPMDLVAKCDPTLVAKIRNLVDYAIELESFAGSERETHPAFKEYNGLLHIHKITAINTLTAYMPETCDLAFKLRRKKFVIEKLHLPPELQESNNEEQQHTNSAELLPTLSCSTANITSNAKVSMDF